MRARVVDSTTLTRGKATPIMAIKSTSPAQPLEKRAGLRDAFQRIKWGQPINKGQAPA